MEIVVIGATGNLGSATVRELTAHGEHRVRAVARRPPDRPDTDVGTSVTWHAADVATDDLVPLLRGADAVVHLAWKFQPTHDPGETWETNVVGTRRVLDAVLAAGVPTVVVASSIAAYSPAGDTTPVDESWPTDGSSTAAYCREKAYNERMLEAFAAQHPDTRLVVLRPAFVFQRSAASEQRRIFGGALLRPQMVRRSLLPVLPLPRGLAFQAVHAGDVGRAVLAAVTRDVRGAFNLAGDGVLTRREVGEVMGARTFEVPATPISVAMGAAWHLRVLPVPGTLLDALLACPVLDTTRSREVLGWTPEHTGVDALEAVVSGIPQRGGSGMPPLHR